MASSRPVRIWVMRQTANREPKFHQAEMLDGAGRSIRELLIIFLVLLCMDERIFCFTSQ